MFLRALAAIAVLVLASCGSAGLHIPNFKPYRMEIQQGNFISQDMVSQLKPGMTQDQVRFVLGTPLITDSFHANRWDYVFRRQLANSNELEERRISVFFEDGKLKRVGGDVTPAADAGLTANKAAEAQAGTDKPAAQSDSAASQAAPAAVAPASPAQAQPQEKSWWQKLKEKF